MESFNECCEDADLIEEVLIGDDGSDDHDVKTMWEYGRVLRSPLRGHAYNLNNLYSHVKTEWVFHCEDDWLFTRKGHFIRECLEIAEKLDNVKQVGIFRTLREEGVRVIDGVCEIQDYAAYGGERNPTFSLNPGLTNATALKEIGLFKPIAWMELDFGIRYQRAGFVKANTLNDYCTHIGDISAYELNNMSKGTKGT